MSDSPFPQFMATTSLPSPICNRKVNEFQFCSAEPKWHIIWNLENASAACEEHYNEAKRHWFWMGAHELTEICSHPNSYYDPEDNRCHLDDGSEDPSLQEKKELVLV